jgi:TetR/AcrR family transcriptional repressor of nem operon
MRRGLARPVRIDDRALLDRAMHAFWENGYRATSIRHLEDTLDVRAPAIYHRFESKEALFLRVIDHYIETVIDPRIATCLGATSDPTADLLRFFESTLSASGHGPREWGSPPRWAHWRQSNTIT